MDDTQGDAVSRMDAAVSALKSQLGGAEDIDMDPSAGLQQHGKLFWRTLPERDRTETLDVGQLRESIAAHEWAEAASLQQVAELERAIVDLKTEIALLRGQEGWLLSTNEDLIERLANAREDTHRNAEVLGDTYREVAQLRLALAESEKNASRQKRCLNEAERQREEAASMVTFLADQLRLLRSENYRLTASLEDYEARIESSRRRQRIILEALLSNGHVRKIGEILRAADVITNEQLDAAIASQASSQGRMVGAILIECGHAGEDDVAQAVACQCKVYLIRLDDTTVDEETARRLGCEFCHLHECIPVRSTEDCVFMAMANPRAAGAIDRVEAALGRRIEPFMATPSDLAATIGRVFDN